MAGDGSKAVVALLLVVVAKALTEVESNGNVRGVDSKNDGVRRGVVDGYQELSILEHFYKVMLGIHLVGTKLKESIGTG
ncbi:hypothetical protein C0993_004541 [Termitomyces sp. T159_Od127]|nr:hypothetical protein C0993_004541 [Termitomyces sp. T159_Od127]